MPSRPFASAPWRSVATELREDLHEVQVVKIRLTRMGAKKRPYYRVVAVDSRTRRDGRPLEFLGTYDPVSRGKTLNLDVPRVDAWLAKGAQLSATAAALLSRARATAAAVPAATPAGETEAS